MSAVTVGIAGAAAIVKPIEVKTTPRAKTVAARRRKDGLLVEATSRDPRKT
jgi:hypothetical protein